jgi:hypothetical protein
LIRAYCIIYPLVKSIEISNIEEMPYILKGKFYFIGNFLHEPNWNAAVFKEGFGP